MAKNGVIKRLADDQDISVEQLVTRSYERAGSLEGAARALGVNRNTVRYYLRKFGYQRVVINELVKQEAV